MADDLRAGPTPCVRADGLTVKDLCNHVLTAKLRKKDAGELTARLIAELSFTGTDLEGGWIDFPRPRTGIPRCPLWPETVAAIRAAVDGRPKPTGRR